MSTESAIALLIISSVTMIVIMLGMVRGTRHAMGFDQRLAGPREQSLKHRPRGENSKTTRGNVWNEIARTLVRSASMLAPVGAGARKSIATELRKAGFAQMEALSVFLAIKIGCAGTVAAASAGWATTTAIGAEHLIVTVLAGAGGFAIGGLLPEYFVRARKANRTTRMSDVLPDALDLLVMCLDSGLTFERAMSTVASELQPLEPNLASELRIMEAELRVGGDRRSVLQGFQERCTVEGLKDMANSLIQSERYGTPLGQSMRNIATNERLNREARIETKTQRLPVLMTLPTLLFVVPGTIMLIAGPAALTALKALSAMGGEG